MSRINSRLAAAVEPGAVPEADVVHPAEHVDMVSIERGIDGPMVDLVDDVNESRGEYAECRQDARALSEIATSLEEFSLIAMESLDAETGLEPQTLMAIQYGVNQHLSRVGQSLEFKSLESNELSELQKTVMSVEGLGEALGKVWDGVVNVAKRAATSVLAFLGNMRALLAKIKEKATALKAQFLALDDKATGTIKSSAAKRLYYGDKSFRQLNELTTGFFKTATDYLNGYSKSTLAESEAITRDMTSYTSEGLPKVDPADVATYIKNEEARRERFLKLGYGGRPRSSEMSTQTANLRVDYSAALPGGYRFVSNQPVMDSSTTAVGDALLAMPEATFELEADKASGAPAELPVLSTSAGAELCQDLIDFCNVYGKAVDASIDAGEKWWKVEYAGDEAKYEKAFEQIQVLSGSDRKKLEENPEFAKLVGKGAKVGIKYLSYASLGLSLVSGASTGSLTVAVLVFGSTFIAYLIPSVLIGAGLSLLFGSMFTPSGKASEMYFKSTDPNAPLLALLRGLASARSWIGMYTVDSIYAVGDYFSKLGPAMIEYLADSAKAHVQAAEKPAGEPAAA